jgi:glycosyltransferase involved in cell wall biosynthesis
MKLVVVSHACATPSNQDLFARVERLTGWTVTIVLPRLWKGEYGALQARRWEGFKGGLRPLAVGLNGNIPLHFYLAPLSRLFREERPDAIFVQHDPHALATMQAFRANRHGRRVPIGFKNDQNLPKRYPWPVRRGELLVYREAAFAFTPARPPADALRAKGYAGPLSILPYSVDMDWFRPSDADGPSGEPLVVGYVGRLVPEKGLSTLLEALAMAPRDVRALIAGSGPSEADLRALATRLDVADRVEWRGYVEHRELPSTYRAMDLLVLPSRTTRNWVEQFGRVVIEALASGVPVCTSDSGEPPTLVEKTGGGWTFPEGSAESLAGLLHLACAHREQLSEKGAAGRARVSELFSAEAVAKSFVETIRRYGA